MKRTQILINKLIYLGLLILETSERVMYDFWFDYVKPKYGEKVKLYYMGTSSSTNYIKNRRYLCIHCKKQVTSIDTSKYELDRLLPQGKKIKKLLDK